MGSPLVPRVIALFLVASLPGAGSACTEPPEGTGISTTTAASAPRQPGPGSGSRISAIIDQFRDTYASHVVQIQVSNNGPSPVIVTAAALRTSLFSGTVAWSSSPDGTEVPAGQTKSLPAQLASPVCEQSGNPSPDRPVLLLTLSGQAAEEIAADDPHGVLARNNAELCLAEEVAQVVHLELSPELRPNPSTDKAVLQLRCVPQGTNGSVIIDSIQGTTLIAEDTDYPWPRSLMLGGGGAAGTVDLSIRPRRCDPHAVAEDKVGTLLPLNVTAGGRTGVIKLPAPPPLRAAIQDFVISACQAGGH